VAVNGDKPVSPVASIHDSTLMEIMPPTPTRPLVAASFDRCVVSLAGG